MLPGVPVVTGQFRSPPRPIPQGGRDSQACHRLETQLHELLRELGRIIVEETFNHLEPHDRRDMPNQMCFQGANRQRIADLLLPWTDSASLNAETERICPRGP